MFVLPEYGSTATEHDPEKPWIVRGVSHDSVTLEDGASFFAWAAEHWPAWESRGRGWGRRAKPPCGVIYFAGEIRTRPDSVSTAGADRG
jgi:hypothetical protein